MQYLYDKVPKFWQECGPKCRPIPKDYKTAETDTETDISAEISADTDNFRSLIPSPYLKHQPKLTVFRSPYPWHYLT
jgi:hypothetical protein